MPDSPNDPAADLPPEIEQRFLALLDEPQPVRTRLLAELCAEHPDHASALRAWFDECNADVDPETPPSLGPYRILRHLGSGGMGTVFLAEQDSPVRRRVAVKLARETVESADSWRRFELEQQVLARMEHSAIAKVFDAGRDARGRPYLVMEVIDGQPITTFCNAHRLDLEARLRLLQEVCAGVQHAHEKGVIHRDLKPSNILVVEQSGKAVPKVIDFGLARLVDAAVHPLHTRSDLLLGTPAYMSPEQAGLARDLDTRADVYGLGVVLYELLTGELPLDPADLAHLAREEMLRRVRETEPPPPSRRAQTAARHVGDERATTTAILSRRLRGDLDWIALRALAKERSRRYGTPAELSAEIERYLRHEPVLAGPPSAWYRLRRLATRHKAAVAATAGIAVALVAGLVVSALAWRETAAKVRELDNLALAVRLQRAQVIATTLRPALPARAAELAAWLDEHAPLAAALPAVDAFLADLRRQGRAASADERAARAARDPQAPSLAALAARHDELAQSVAAAGDDTETRVQRANARVRLTRLQPELADLRARIDDRASYVFEHAADAMLHATVATLRHDLQAFVADDGLWSEMRARLRFAREVTARTIDAPAVAWAAAAAVVKADPRFGGLDLHPQLGLIPLGRDPDSGLGEFLHLASHAASAPLPQRGPDGRLAFAAECGIVLVLLPGGTFTMGEQATDPAAPNYNEDATDEWLAHRVTLAPFFLAKHELTQAQWRRMSGGDEPSSYSARMDTPYGKPTWTCPVEMVTWARSRALLLDHDLALPTEAQWEYGCRAGTTTRWWTGDTVASLQGAANVPDAAVLRAKLVFGDASDELDDGFPGPAPVDALRPNPFGLHHMHGNVWEWCEDREGSYALAVRAGDGLRLVPSLLSGRHVYRGGSWYEKVGLSCSAYRWSEPESVHWEVTGVRAARALGQ